jgi:hypothetical protein
MIEELASRVFAARDAAHRAHWRTGSFAQHMALEEFYEGVIEGIDEIIEVHQGVNGLIDQFSVEVPPISNIAAWVQAEADWIAENRDLAAACNDAVRNLIDGLGAIYRRAIYRLTQLT